MPHIDNLDSQGHTALFLACKKGNLEVATECAKLLINAGANVNFSTKTLKMNPLHWAASNGDARLVKLLLRNKALQTKSARGFVPVDMAGFCDKRAVVEVFAADLSIRIYKKLQENQSNNIDSLRNSIAERDLLQKALSLEE